jgi:hypothetical protein
MLSVSVRVTGLGSVPVGWVMLGVLSVVLSIRSPGGAR